MSKRKLLSPIKKIEITTTDAYVSPLKVRSFSKQKSVMCPSTEWIGCKDALSIMSAVYYGISSKRLCQFMNKVRADFEDQKGMMAMELYMEQKKSGFRGQFSTQRELLDALRKGK